MVNGVMVSRLDDPDVYRSIIDAALIALEEGDEVGGDEATVDHENS